MRLRKKFILLVVIIIAIFLVIIIAKKDKPPASFIISPAAPEHCTRPNCDVEKKSPPNPNLKLSIGGRFNGEPTIAINPANPNNLIAAWMHSREKDRIEIVVVSSKDGGATWTDPFLLGHVAPIYTASADVSVVFDNTGTAHLTYIEMEPDPNIAPSCEFHMGSAEVVHRRSNDGGRTWSAPVRVRHSSDTPDFAIDRPWVAVDRSGGPFNGRVYVVSISFFCNNNPPQHVHLRWSMDQGATWSDDMQVDNAEYGTGPYPNMPFPAAIGVGGDGAVWIVYPSASRKACSGGFLSPCLLVAVSHDGGQTFSRSKVANVTSASRRGFLLFPTLAVDQVRGGRASIFWPDGRFDSVGSDLLFVQSEDGGKSWSEPVRINDNPLGLGVGVDESWAAAADDGGIAVLWRDRRSAGSGSEVAFEAYAAVSANGGANFMPNIRLSDKPSPYSAVPCCNSFLGLTLGGGRLHAVWADFRENHWEIFYSSSYLVLSSKKADRESDGVKSQSGLTQQTWRERMKERWERFKEKIREKLIEKKREELAKQETEIGLGGIDARIPLKWITETGQEGAGFVYGAGDYGRKLRFDDIERFYEIHVSSDYNTAKPAPVVLNFHGGGGYPAGARYQSGMDLVADKNGFIVVYPAGTGKLFNDRLLTWNDGRPDKDGKPYTANDVGFVAALLDDLAVFFNVDNRRIYATGISNGAQFSYTLANKLSDRIAAIAPIAGQRTVEQYFPPPPRPISVMQFSGLEDKLAPYYGGTPPKKAGPVTIDFEWTMRPVKEAISSWAAHNGCSTEFAEATMIGKAVMTRFSSQCKDNTEVILWTLEDGGHTWPGGKMFPSEVKAGQGHINTDISASELMWEFFKKHSMKFEPPIFQYDVDGDEM